MKIIKWDGKDETIEEIQNSYGSAIINARVCEDGILKLSSDIYPDVEYNVKCGESVCVREYLPLLPITGTNSLYQVFFTDGTCFEFVGSVFYKDEFSVIYIKHNGNSIKFSWYNVRSIEKFL